MGAYINPPVGTKEEFLEKNGQKISKETAVSHIDFESNMVVALLNNGPFTAACIAFDDRELKEVTRDDDYRPTTYFTVAKSLLLENSNLNTYLE